MNFIKNMDSHHLSILQMLDGREFSYIPQWGAPRAINGFLQAHSELIDGDSVDIVTKKTMLYIRTIDAPEIVIGDEFVVEDKSYKVSVIIPDEEGMTQLTLARA